MGVVRRVKCRAVLARELGDNLRERPSNHVRGGDVERAPARLGYVNTQSQAAAKEHRIFVNAVVDAIADTQPWAHIASVDEHERHRRKAKAG